jgi:hypothetical protein
VLVTNKAFAGIEEQLAVRFPVIKGGTRNLPLGCKDPASQTPYKVEGLRPNQLPGSAHLSLARGIISNNI